MLPPKKIMFGRFNLAKKESGERSKWGKRAHFMFLKQLTIIYNFILYGAQ